MQITTLIFPINEQEVLLGLKKRGFGNGLWNGFGGKVLAGETVEQAALRELEEECGLTAHNLEKFAELNFKFADGLHIITHVFFSYEYSGQIKETEEMRPQWFIHSQVPYQQMWTDDKLWLPKVLNGEKLSAVFHFDDAQNQNILHYEIKQQTPKFS